MNFAKIVQFIKIGFYEAEGVQGDAAACPWGTCQEWHLKSNIKETDPSRRNKHKGNVSNLYWL